MMRTLVRTAAVLAAAAVSSACLTSSTVVKLNADGSGTVEQTTAMSKEAVAQLEQFAAGMAQGKEAEGAAGGKSGFDLFSEEKAKDEASKFGSGVTFVSAEKIDRDGLVGLKTVYAFTDVGKLQVKERPEGPGGAMGGEPSAGQADDDIRFGFERLGGTSALTIHLADKKTSGGDTPDAGPDQPAAAPAPEQLAMVKQLFKGLRVEIAVEVAGDIVKTNADYVDGRRVTLLAMDFEKILDNDALLAKIQNPKSMADAKAALKGIEGFKINAPGDVRVEFAAR